MSSTMGSVFDTTKAKPLVERALAARNLRQEVISSNIANIDTPLYRARGVNFEDALIKQANEMYGKKDPNTPKLALAQTDKNHLKGTVDKSGAYGTIFLRDGHMARNDGNTVDLDVETSELSKNATMVNALTKALKKQSAIFKSVLEAAGKV